MTAVRRPRRIGLVLVLLAILAGCDSPVLDPTQRARTWQPEGINQQNIAVMVADPHDLATGRDDPGSDGRAAVSAIRRWRAGPAAAGGAADAGASGSGSGMLAGPSAGATGTQ